MSIVIILVVLYTPEPMCYPIRLFNLVHSFDYLYDSALEYAIDWLYKSEGVDDINQAKDLVHDPEWVFAFFAYHEGFYNLTFEYVSTTNPVIV